MSPYDERRGSESFDDWLRRAVGWSAGRSAMRASDAEREAVAERLRQAHAEGRLDTAELEERISRCYGAKTLGELDRLLYDLPTPVATPASGRPRGWWALLVPVVLVLLVVTVASHGHAAFLWPLAVFLVFRLTRGRRWRTRQYF